MHVENLVFVTGASRGLGAALAQCYARPNTLLVTMSRAALPWAAQTHPSFDHRHVQADLSTPEGARIAVEQIQGLLSTQAQRYVLINNAGTVAPVAACKNLDDSTALTTAYQLNLLSPISLCSAFLQHAPHKTQRQILNISSGAGRRPVAGWAVYGSTKAALDYYTQVLQQENPDLQVVSLAPGVIDTDMQAHIRSQDRDNFPDLNRFIDLHKNQQLSSAELTAQRIVAYLDSPNFGRVTIDDIRHYE